MAGQLISELVPSGRIMTCHSHAEKWIAIETSCYGLGQRDFMIKREHCFSYDIQTMFKLHAGHIINVSKTISRSASSNIILSPPKDL
jgi:hypothetical protein